MIWWRLIPGPIRRGVSWLLGAVVFALFFRNIGRRDERHKATNKALTDNIKTRKRMDEADIVGDDPDAARRWLHERSKR